MTQDGRAEPELVENPLCRGQELPRRVELFSLALPGRERYARHVRLAGPVGYVSLEELFDADDCVTLQVLVRSSSAAEILPRHVDVDQPAAR